MLSLTGGSNPPKLVGGIEREVVVFRGRWWPSDEGGGPQTKVVVFRGRWWCSEGG